MAKRKWTNEEVEEYRKIHGAFYYNNEDSNIFVPKAYGIGFTFNWGNPVSKICILALVIFIIIRTFLK